MDKKVHFSPASEKGHFDGLVDEGKYLRQSSLYKQILPRTQSRLKTYAPPVTKNLFNQRNPRLINDLRSTKVYVRKNKLFMQNKAKFRKVKLNVNKVLTKDYDQMDTWSIRKNEPKTNPIQTQSKANTNPIQTQFKPKQTQSVASLSNLFQAAYLFSIGT